MCVRACVNLSLSASLSVRVLSNTSSTVTVPAARSNSLSRSVCSADSSTRHVDSCRHHTHTQVTSARQRDNHVQQAVCRHHYDNVVYTTARKLDPQISVIIGVNLDIKVRGILCSLQTTYITVLLCDCKAKILIYIWQSDPSHDVPDLFIYLLYKRDKDLVTSMQENTNIDQN